MELFRSPPFVFLVILMIICFILMCAQIALGDEPKYSGDENTVTKQIIRNCHAHPWLGDVTVEENFDVRLWDKTRVDILTETHAIEVDWSRKWAEAIGQSLYYAQSTGTKPGIILLIKDMKKEQQFVYRCQMVATNHNIKVWLVYTKPELFPAVRAKRRTGEGVPIGL